MKSLLLSLAILFSLASLASAVPRLTVDQAGAMAQKELKDRGLDGRVYVVSLSIEADGALNKEMYWLARWSEAVVLDPDSHKKEVGIRINMDGSTVRLVEGPGSVNELTHDSRTRSDRPSILDTKR